MNYNKAILLGRVVRMQDLKTTGSGKNVINFTLVTNQYYKDAAQQWKETAEFHNCTIWGQSAERAAQRLQKGMLVFVEGRMSTSSYEKNGVKQYSTKVVVHNIQYPPKEKTEAPVDAPLGEAPPAVEDPELANIPF